MLLNPPDSHPPPAGNPRERKGIASVETAIALLRILERAPAPMSLSQLAKVAGFPSSKTHHYVVSLIRTGLARQDPDTGLYGLGSYALELGMAALDKTQISPLVVEALRAFSAEMGETAFFALWSERGPVVVHWVGGRQSVSVSVRVGTLLPLHDSPTGDVFLTWMPVERTAAALANATDDAAHLSPPQLEAIRQRTLGEGSAHASGVRTPTVAAVSVPVFGHDGRLAGALTSLGLVGKFDDSPGSVLSVNLRHRGAALSRALG
jgi:DNA-binding IclR family transcriptional regulator